MVVVWGGSSWASIVENSPLPWQYRLSKAKALVCVTVITFYYLITLPSPIPGLLYHCSAQGLLLQTSLIKALQGGFILNGNLILNFQVSSPQIKSCMVVQDLHCYWSVAGTLAAQCSGVIGQRVSSLEVTWHWEHGGFLCCSWSPVIWAGFLT